LLGEKENTYPKSSLDKKNKSEIEKLRQEIKQLENDSQNSNSEQQKELAEKRKRLRELEKERNNTTSANKSDNDKLLVYVSLGGVILLIGGLFLASAVRTKRKNK
jgi:transcription elongation GreA/GreB family factor